MSQLMLHGKRIDSLFQLLGSSENAATYSLGYALSQSPALLRALVRDLFGKAQGKQVHSVLLQEHQRRQGITDIELSGSDLHCIIEAKKGWVLPSKKQLSQYAARIETALQHRALLVLSECTPEYARGRLPKAIGDVPVAYRSWVQIHTLAARKRKGISIYERAVLRQLATYLRSLVSMQDQESNLVYVLSLGSGTPKWSKISQRDIVVKKRRYFHPHGGNGWPKEPPNYLGFRYDGRLQAIHHVERYEIVTEMHSHIPEVDPGEWGPYVLYHLGRPIVPDHKIKTGKIYPNGRVWAAIDLLLTSTTIKQARDLTKKRLGAASS